MIDRVTITGFKKIDRLELSLASPTTVLLGGNNSGKSSVLEAIHLATSAAQVIRLSGNAEWLDDKIRTVVPQENLSSARVDVRNATNGEFQAESRRCSVTLSPRPDSVEIAMTGQLLGEQVMAVDTPFCIYVPGLAGIPLREAALAEGAVFRAIARGDSNLVLRNVLYLLKKDAAGWQAFIEDLGEIFPNSEFDFRFRPATDDMIRVEYRHGSGPMLPLENAGTGVLQCIQLLAYSRLFKPGVLLLDEPDAHLHPTNQRRLCRLVVRLASEQPNVRVIIATHSRHLVSALRGDAHLCWLKDGVLLPSEGSDLIAGLLELGALDDGEKLAGRTLKCLVLTEDENQEVLEALLWSSSFVEDETLVLSYKGCSNRLTVAALCQAFGDRMPGVRIVVHRDRDYCDAEAVEEIRQDIRKAGAIPFVTSGTDAESYYLAPGYLSEFGVGGADLVTLLETAASEARTESLRKMIGGRYQLAVERKEKREPLPDAGKVALAAVAEFESNPMAFLHGKASMARVRTLLLAHSVNPKKFFRKSESVRVVELTQIAQEIWTAAEGKST
jgi:predicted ATPase